MRSLLAAGLLAGVAASAVLAQDKPYDAGTVLATVNGNEITLGHVIALSDRLPQQYQQLPDDVLLTGCSTSSSTSSCWPRPVGRRPRATRSG